MTHELSESELFEALHYAKSIDEETGAQIIGQFQLEQTALAEIMFGMFPTFIAEQNQEMSYLFMDLCFDVLCVFQKAFGSLPSQNDMNFDWLEKQATLLAPEFKSLVKEQHMDEQIRSKFQDRFIQRSSEETVQRDLVNFMNAAIDDFALEDASRAPATKITQTMISIVIRLFSNLYNNANKTS